MASTKEIKDRIESVRETQKITNAMYLISSTKLRKAKADLQQTRPYFTALRNEIKRIFRTAGNVDSRYFYPENQKEADEGTFALLVITADKGLAGAYNQNVIKEAVRIYGEHPDTKLFVVGEYGRHYFDQHRIPVEHSFLYTAQNPTMQRAREICSILLEGFDRGDFSKIYIIYTDMQNSMSSEARTTRLLPFHRTYFTGGEGQKESVMQSYISGFIYSALIDSFCSEQNARMTAMDSANKNAEKLLSELSLNYNRERQALITQEITEISAGARAQKRGKHRKEAETA